VSEAPKPAVAMMLGEFNALIEQNDELRAGGGVILAPAQRRFGVMPENAGDVDLDSMEADRPGEGWESKVLQLACDLADKHGLSIYVRAHASSEDDHDLPDMQGRLEGFYAKHGFAITGSWGASDMLRKPKPFDHEAEARLTAWTAPVGPSPI
jgi:hypothetical protein